MLAWGRNSLRRSSATAPPSNATRPVRVEPAHAAPRCPSRCAGLLHALALTKGGSVLAWGSNYAGQLGIGGTDDRHLPVLVHLPAR